MMLVIGSIKPHIHIPWFSPVLSASIPHHVGSASYDRNVQYIRNILQIFLQSYRFDCSHKLTFLAKHIYSYMDINRIESVYAVIFLPFLSI